MTATPLPVVYQCDNGIARIRFNRPEVLNAVDRLMAEGFRDATLRIAADPTVRVVVLSGNGRAFMAGGDLSSLRADPIPAAHALIEPLNEGIAILNGLAQPVIASLHGSIAGAGVSLALCCDLAIAADDTTFNLAYARVGTSLDGSGSWSLPRIVGLRKAMELALLAETVDAAEALRLNLVNRVVPSADLPDATNALARKLADGPTLAYGRIKQLLRASFNRDLAAQMADELTCFAACAGSTDFVEGLAAFFERRKPNFMGA